MPYSEQDHDRALERLASDIANQAATPSQHALEVSAEYYKDRSCPIRWMQRQQRLESLRNKYNTQG